MRKILAVLLSMILTTMPLTAFAADIKETAGRSSFTLRTCCDPGKRKTLQL